VIDMRHTNREIEQAKMLSRKVSASQNVSAPPLSRVRVATTLFFSAIALRLKMFGAALWRNIRDKSICPCCAGAGIAHHFDYADGYTAQCRLCLGSGEVTWREVESHKWGEALKRYRLSLGYSLPQMYYVLPGNNPHQIERMEQGLVPLDQWPLEAVGVAELQLDREAAGHVSTT
jgi:hypothetical protein